MGKIFCQNSDYFGGHFIKNAICIYVFTLYLQKTHLLSLFKICTLNFTMYILTILTCPLKTCVIRLCYIIWEFQ